MVFGENLKKKDYAYTTIQVKGKRCRGDKIRNSSLGIYNLSPDESYEILKFVFDNLSKANPGDVVCLKLYKNSKFTLKVPGKVEEFESTPFSLNLNNDNHEIKINMAEIKELLKSKESDIE